MDADQPITVEKGDADVTLSSPPPVEINGVISETVKEEDEAIVVEETEKEIKSFLNGVISETVKEEDEAIVVEETEKEIKSFLELTDYASEVKNEEQVELDVALVAPADHKYNPLPSSDAEPEAVLPIAKEEEKVEETSLIKEELKEKEEKKSVEVQLPVSSVDRAVGECQTENLESVQISGGHEKSGENQPSGAAATNHHSSWKDCCGLFNVLGLGQLSNR